MRWLVLNHHDYQDVKISQANLAALPENEIPVIIDYRQTDTSNIIPSTLSKHDCIEEEGTAEGPCPFVVHGLTGEEYDKMSMKSLKIKALQHLGNGGMALGIGHSEDPLSIYNNSQLYPQLFPWLFPYGLGGIGQYRHKHKLSEKEHKKWLLQYYDKRFQTDLYFPIIAFNHEQIKASVTGSFIMAKRSNFMILQIELSIQIL